jgi:NTP pyrophosphatase (non-canonical NTP hydrolase)
MDLIDDGHKANDKNKKCAYCEQAIIFPFSSYECDDGKRYCSQGCYEMAGMTKAITNMPEKKEDKGIAGASFGMGLANLVRACNLPDCKSLPPKEGRGQTPPDPFWSLANAVVALRPSVVWFAVQMERKLALHDDREGWSKWEVSKFPYLLARLGEELQELMMAIDIAKDATMETASACSDAIVEEAADIANFAMMIADIATRQWHRCFGDYDNADLPPNLPSQH